MAFLDEAFHRLARRQLDSSHPGGSMLPVSDLIVLCYHAISERWDSPLAVTPAQLKAQLSALLARGYRGARFDAVMHPPHEKTVVVTFDDGFRSVFELAYPILSELGLPGTVFVPSSFMDTDEPMSWQGIEQWTRTADSSELLPMSWEQLNLLAESGWEVGSHARTHPHLTRLRDADLAAELTGSRHECEAALGRPCRTIAYPYGEADNRVARAAAAAGYEAAAVLGHRPVVRQMMWPRVGIYRADSERRFTIKVSRLTRGSVGSALVLAAASARRLLQPRSTRGAPARNSQAATTSLRITVVELTPIGGLLHYSVQLADALAARGHEVDILAPRGNELAHHRGPANMRAVLTPHIRSLRTRDTGKLAYQIRRAGIAARLVRGWSRMMWATRVGGYDVMLTGADLSIWLGVLAMHAHTVLPRRPPIAFICHNVKPFNRWKRGGLLLSDDRTVARLRRLYRRFDLVVVHGERGRKDFEETWPKVPLVVVPHGDQRIFAGDPPPPGTEERILFFGDWRKVKGLPVLMEAFDDLVSRRPTVRLTIAGTPSPADFDPESVRRWAARHGERVTLIDRYVPIDDVGPLFAKARVVVTPYLVGYQSGVVSLSMTMARAVVATDVGDLPASVIHGETGLVVPPGDAKALAGALEEIVADGALAERFGAEGRRKALENSNWAIVAARLEEAILSLVDSASRRR